MYKKLVSPEFRINTEKYEITGGAQVECFSSREARSDWCRIDFATAMHGRIAYEDMERATVELGYGDDYDMLLSGYCRKTAGDYWKELLIRDAMIKLERTTVKATFVKCSPQDIIKYVLAQAGVTDYRLSDAEYGVKETFVADRQDGVKTIAQTGSMWGIHCDFFFRDGVFYWGCSPLQDTVYVLEEQNILSLKKYGELYEIETFGVPWIHHSQTVEVSHAKYAGLAMVEKTIIRSDVNGYTRMFIYFKGGGCDV